MNKLILSFLLLISYNLYTEANSNQNPKGSQVSTIDEQQQALQDFWQQFQSPELDHLIALALEKNQTKVELKDFHLSLVSEIVHFYTNIETTQQLLQLTKEEIIELEDLSSIEQTGTLLEEKKSMRSLLQITLDKSISDLVLLLGENEQSFKKLKSLKSSIDLITFDLSSTLLRRRPDMSQAESAIAPLLKQMGLSIVDFFPQFSLYHTRPQTWSLAESNNWLSSSSQAWTIGPTIQWNLTHWNKRLSQMEENLTIPEEFSLVSYKQILFTALQEVENCLVFYLEEQKRLSILEAHFQTLTLEKKIKRDLFAADLISFSDRLNNILEFYETKIACIQSERTLYARLIALYKASGGSF